MDINTIFNAISLSSIYGSYGPPKQRDRESRRLCNLRSWLLRHDEKQRAEIKDHEEGFELYRSGVEIMKTNYEEKIARLQGQVATYERIITSNIEDSKRVGDSAKPYMNEGKCHLPRGGEPK